MYRSKQILPAHGQLKVNVLFRFEDKASKVETGYSQSVNVATNKKQMFEEAVLNAFYKLNHRIGETLFRTDDYNEDLSLYVKNFTLLKHEFFYYEDRIYSYKRVKQHNKYKYEIRRKGRVFKYVNPKYLSKKEKEKIVDDIL